MRYRVDHEMNSLVNLSVVWSGHISDRTAEPKLGQGGRKDQYIPYLKISEAAGENVGSGVEVP